ncbi:MAG: 8-amino-7-oxononanoate synthase [Porticoccaceae bacterium]|nr:8-amino-7-oxononanoate synthase [Porticoccaceae bacterium]
MARTRAELEAAGLRPFGAVTEHLISATEAIVEGRPVILAGTNNYLGLSYDPRCIAAAREATARWGTGTTGSRMANGTFAEHLALEAELAELYGVSQAMVFTTGFAATQGLCATLAGPGDVILLDADSHASIYSGAQLSGAEVIRFKHSDPADLEKRLRRLGARAADTLIVVEGIYSMLGDTAPLAEIAAIKRAYGGLLMVDEAHSLGVLGEQGRGAAAAAGVADAVDFFVGTFSKSLGAIGGFCASPHAALEAVRFSTRAYIFTASAAPSVIASTRAALAIMRAEPELQRRLWANAERLHAGLSGLGLAVGPQPGPVVAVALGDRETALTAWQRLLEAGVYVNLVVPPASPTGASLLRCSVSAAHSETQITRVVAAFAECVAPRATPP